MLTLVQRFIIGGLCLILLAGCGDDGGADGGDRDAVTSPPADTSTSTTDEPAGMRVVPGTGIAGVDIDDSMDEVTETMGAPDEQTSSRNEFSGETDTVLAYSDPDLRVIVAQGVNQVESTDPGAQTSDGVGIGSSTQDVKDAFPDVACDGTAIVVCSVGERTAGEVATDFMLEDDKVVRVVVGRLLE